MYIEGYLVPVPAQNKDAYVDVARWVGELMMEHGALEIVEAWEETIKDGKHTDFRMAVKAQPGEKVVFSWVIWPDKQTSETAHENMMKDPRFSEEMEMPFDGKRMVLGSFTPALTFGKD